MTNHPDIEIYIKNCKLDEVLQWLSERLDSVKATGSKGMLHQFSASYQGHKFAIAVHEKALGKAWISVWFQSNTTPWKVDLDCAREASAVLKAQVRCIASGWQEGDDPDEWWKVEEGQEVKMQWVTD